MSLNELLLDQRVRLGNLFDCYETFLTRRQRRACEMLLKEDLTFTELAEAFDITRQGAFDLVRRSRQQMEQIEQSLRLIDLHHRHEALLRYLLEKKEELPECVYAQLLQLLGENTHDV